MRRADPRPFGVVDAVVLLAFAAAGLGAAVWMDGQDHRADPRANRPKDAAYRPDWVLDLCGPAQRAVQDLQTFLVVMTLGVGTATLRRRGLLRGRRWPGPGVAAGMVGAVALLYCLAHQMASLGSASPWASQNVRARFFLTFFLGTNMAPEGAIIGAWAVLALARGWRPLAGDWDDRAGRLVGWSWLAIGLYYILYPILWT